MTLLRVSSTAQLKTLKGAKGALIPAANPRDHFLIQHLLCCRCFSHAKAGLA